MAPEGVNGLRLPRILWLVTWKRMVSFTSSRYSMIILWQTEQCLRPAAVRHSFIVNTEKFIHWHCGLEIWVIGQSRSIGTIWIAQKLFILLLDANRKPCAGYRMVTVSMTLSDPDPDFKVAVFFW